jgi:N-dimethylarginine dimethylaminohydrolase
VPCLIRVIYNGFHGVDLVANQAITTFRTFNGHSMVGTLQCVLVCSPRTVGWNQPERAARWRELGFLRPPDFQKAQAEHDHLCHELEAAGAEVVEAPPALDLSLDAVYAHDALFPTDFGLIVMRPGKPNRACEGKHQAAFCSQLGFFGAHWLSVSSQPTPPLDFLGPAMHAKIVPPGTTEAGDTVWLDEKTLLIGHGYRTNATGIAQMRGLLAPRGVEVIAAPLPYGPGPSACLHLMSLISLLDEETALVDLQWLAVETVEFLLARGYRFIEIESSERDTLACNVLSLGRKRLLALEENQKTNEKLRQAGFDVRTFPGSELCINGSGGPTCLTRPLLRG